MEEEEEELEEVEEEVVVVVVVEEEVFTVSHPTSGELKNLEGISSSCQMDLRDLVVVAYAAIIIK